MLRRALAIRLKALGEAHPDYRSQLQQPGRVSFGPRGSYAEAEAMHRRALAINLKALGEGHLHTAASYNNLALNLRAQGKHAEAEADAPPRPGDPPEGPGRGPPRHRRKLQQPGREPSAQGKHAEAEAMHRRALAIRLKALGGGHPLTALSYNNLAVILAARGSLPRPRRWTAAPWRSG